MDDIKEIKYIISNIDSEGYSLSMSSKYLSIIAKTQVLILEELRKNKE